MGIATTLQDYLESRNIAYEVVEHQSAGSALRAAENAHIPGDKIAKPILLGDDHAYLLAVIPATHRLELDRLNQLMARHLEMIDSNEAEATFTDCDNGAVPAIGEAYGVDTVIDTALSHVEDVYFDSGDHRHLIHMSGDTFKEITEHATRIPVSHHL